MGAGELLAQARRTADEAEADRLAIAAVLADPDFAEAYAFRGHLAARRAHHAVRFADLADREGQGVGRAGNRQRLALVPDTAGSPVWIRS